MSKDVISNGRFEKGGSPWNKGIHTIGHPHNELTKKKISFAKMGDLNPAKRQDVREKISKTLKGRFCGENNPFYRKTHTKDTIQKIMTSEGWINNSYKKGHACYTKDELIKKRISNTLKGRILSDITKQKISNSIKKYKKENLCSEETRNKISDALKGKALSMLHKLKLSESHCGKQHSEESKKKMSEKFKGRIHSDITRDRISNALSGENHFNWLGGKSFEPYCPKFNNQLKEHIRNKYGRQCFLCGCLENGRKLCIHHVDYDKTQGCDGKQYRLIPLCNSCHSKTNTKNREYYLTLFNDMLDTQKIEVV